MAVKSKGEIINDIDSHLRESTKEYWSDFYIGITNNIERRLFEEHNVNKENDWWIWRKALDKGTAQEVEEYYLAKGMEGNTGGGNKDTVYVYCYEITENTIQ